MNFERDSKNPLTMSEIMVAAEKLENKLAAQKKSGQKMRHEDEASRNYVDETICFCAELCCYLMNQVNKLAGSSVTAPMTVAALQVIAHEIEEVWSRESDTFRGAVFSYKALMLASGTTVSVNIPRAYMSDNEQGGDE